MERKSTNGGFKLKGHALPGIKQRGSTKMADGRAKSSAFQKDDEEFPGLVDFEVEAKGKDETRDILARKAKPEGTGKTGMEQSVRSLGYKQADEALAKGGSKEAKQRLKDRAVRLAIVKEARRKNPNITQKEINKIMSGN